MRDKFFGFLDRLATASGSKALIEAVKEGFDAIGDETSSPDRMFFVRHDGDDEVTAIMPDLEANPDNVVCYAHVGQHGEASKKWVGECAVVDPSTDTEAGELLAEMQRIGYSPVVMTKAEVDAWLGKGGTVRNVEIRWKDDGSTEVVPVAVGMDPDNPDDDNIFFYCDTEDDFRRLFDEGNGEDFVALQEVE